jgi:hypothetical protein
MNAKRALVVLQACKDAAEVIQAPPVIGLESERRFEPIHDVSEATNAHQTITAIEEIVSGSVWEREDLVEAGNGFVKSALC